MFTVLLKATQSRHLCEILLLLTWQRKHAFCMQDSSAHLDTREVSLHLPDLQTMHAYFSSKAHILCSLLCLIIFRLDASWPGMKDIQLAHASGRELSPEEIETILSQATKNALHTLYPNLDVQRCCIPYFSMHEFEALLFSDVRILGDMLPLDGNKLCSIMAEYGGNPEKINTNRAPSIILIDMYNAYKKTIHGCTIADSIGIPRIREQCSCFETWIASLLE